MATIASPLAGKKILLAATANGAYSVQSRLSATGAEITVCEAMTVPGSGEPCDCAGYLQENPDYQPDLIISNWGIPDLSAEPENRTTPGKELLAARQSLHAGVPIVFITATRDDIAANPNFNSETDKIVFRPQDVLREAEGVVESMSTGRKP